MNRVVLLTLLCAPAVHGDSAQDVCDGAALLQTPPKRGVMKSATDIESVVLHGDGGTPGWVFERILHEPIFCPWLAGDRTAEDDDACVKRTRFLSDMRDKIAQCEAPLAHNMHTIGHRGAPLVAPEETLVSYEFGAKSGAGYLECDVSITKDLDMICRHSNCDLHFTTDLVTAHPDLNEKCSKPFVPGSGEDALCCTFDFTMEELARLCGIMESTTDPSAKTYEDYVVGFPGFRSNAGGDKCHPLVSYDQYLRLLHRSGFSAIPELKDTWMDRTEGFLKSRGKDIYWLADDFATRLSHAGFKPWGAKPHPAFKRGVVYGVMQTFDYRIAFHWKKQFPAMTVEYMWQEPPKGGAWCVDGNGDYHGPEGPGGDCGGHELLDRLNKAGVDMFSPPIMTLLETSPHRSIVPSATAKFLKRLGVPSIGSWSLERQGADPKASQPYNQPPTAVLSPSMLAPAWNPADWYYSTTDGDSTWQHVDVLQILDALFNKVGIKGLFSDYPATVSAFVNCGGLAGASAPAA